MGRLNNVLYRWFYGASPGKQKSNLIATQKANSTNYDMMLSKDLMQHLGIDILKSLLALHWDGIEIHLRNEETRECT